MMENRVPGNNGTSPMCTSIHPCVYTSYKHVNICFCLGYVCVRAHMCASTYLLLINAGQSNDYRKYCPDFPLSVSQQVYTL